MAKKRPYKPKPVDTSKVKLPKELEDLKEKLAEQVHDLWAKSRIEQGWTYGEKRDDDKRTHPGLVPYDELSEEEKDYDRNTALGTLLLILHEGYTIVPPKK